MTILCQFDWTSHFPEGSQCHDNVIIKVPTWFDIVFHQCADLNKSVRRCEGYLLNPIFDKHFERFDTKRQ